MLFTILSSIFHQLNYKARCTAVIAFSWLLDRCKAYRNWPDAVFTVHHPITVHCTLYTVHHPIIVHCSLYTVHCTPIPTLYTVHQSQQCTLFTIHQSQHFAILVYTSLYTTPNAVHHPNTVHYWYTQNCILLIYQTFYTINIPNILHYQYPKLFTPLVHRTL